MRKEIARVLSRVAIVLRSSFLSPYHGYPDHYYNMTNPLGESFSDLLEVEKQKLRIVDNHSS